jgi:hypothetical protein
MANIKFSAFTQKVVQTNVDFLVGYTGADNVRITPAALGDGIYLPLGGGTMVGNVIFNDGVQLRFGNSGADCLMYSDGTDTYIQPNNGNFYIYQAVDNKDISLQCDDGVGGVTPYITLDGSETNTLFSKPARFIDSISAQFGTDGDLVIQHDSADSKIDNFTGDLKIRNYANDKDIIFESDNGSGAVSQYFRLDGSWADGTNVFTAWPDNSIIALGDGADLKIYHDGAHSWISDQGTGNLNILTSSLNINSADDTKVMATFIPSGAVTLKYDNSTKFATTSTGIQVTDEVSIGTSLVHTGDTDTKVSFGTDEIVLTTAGVDRMFVAADGDVGIGTNTPSSYDDEGDNLIVFDTTTPGITIATDTTTSRGSLLFADGTTGNEKYRGGVIYDHGTGMGGIADTMYIRAAVNSYLVLDPTGNVGIGTKTPAESLQIVNSDHMQLRLGTDATYYEFGRNYNTGALWIQGSQVGYNNIALAPNSGDVGIGIAAPLFKLHTYRDDANATPSVTIENDGTGDASIHFLLSGVVGWSAGLDNSDGDAFKIHNSQGFSNSFFTINTTGLNKINSSSSGDHNASQKTGTYTKTSTGSTTAMDIVKVGHTHAVNYTVIAKVDTSNQGTLVGNTSTAYGGNGGMIVDSEAYAGVITDIAVAYDNSFYGFTVAVTYTGASHPIIYMSVTGQSSEDFVQQ